MQHTCLHHGRTALSFVMATLAFLPIAFGQSELQTRTLVINGRSGEALIYRINNQSFIDLETLVRIAHGSMSFQGDHITLTLPVSQVTSADPGPPHAEGMTKGFMTAALQDVGLIKDWHSTIAYAIQRAVPGDGSQLVVFHDRAAEGLRLATVAASSHSDHNALQLLTNHFNQVDRWKRKLVDARKSMSTANYSITPDALEKDPEYQNIANCDRFLGTMLAGGQYKDDPSCH